MIDSRNSRFVVGLILACTCAPALSAQPNEAETALRFQIDGKKSLAWVSRNGRAQGPIAPSYAAVFHVQSSVHRVSSEYKGIRQMLTTSAGKSVSERQRKFLSASDAMVVRSSQNMRNHQTVTLYAVTDDDARKMVEAYLEVGTNAAKAETLKVKTRLQDYVDRAASARRDITKKEVELAVATIEYEKARIETHSPSSDSIAAEESRAIILEMNTVLDSLAIEIAGVEAKLTAIEKIKSEKKVSSPESLARLEDIISEQSIELAGARAKQKTATGIRDREEKFHRLYRQRTSLSKQISSLKNALSQTERSRREAERMMAERELHMLPPQVYENEVTFYRVTRR